MEQWFPGPGDGVVVGPVLRHTDLQWTGRDQRSYIERRAATSSGPGSPTGSGSTDWRRRDVRRRSHCRGYNDHRDRQKKPRTM